MGSNTMKKTKRVRYYSDFSEDFSRTARQDYKLPEDYQWVRRDFRSRLLSGLIYGLALVFAVLYCPMVLHIRFRGRKKLHTARKTGAFVYGNHTQPVGDVFTPALACFPNRIYTLASPANLGIPVLGRLLPYLGALPVPDSLGGLKELTRAMEYRLEENRCIVIYPESHVWEYCGDIRPFSRGAFKYPVKNRKPVYVLTATYQNRRWGKKPRCTVYVDGPIEVPEGSPRQQTAALEEKVREVMENRCRDTTCHYIEYHKRPGR